MALERVASLMPSLRRPCSPPNCLLMSTVGVSEERGMCIKIVKTCIHMKKIEHVQHTNYFTYSIPNESKWPWTTHCQVVLTMRTKPQATQWPSLRPRGAWTTEAAFGQGCKLARFWLEYGRISMHPRGEQAHYYPTLFIHTITIIGLLLWHLGLLHNDKQKPWSWIKHWLKEGSIVFLPFHGNSQKVLEFWSIL